jgi:hypothetical protein
MPKKTKEKRQNVTPEKKERGITLSPLKQDVLFLVLVSMMLVIYFKPMVIDGLSPQGVDIVASKGSTHQITIYNKTADDRALWNPAIFSGMPIYHRSAPVTVSVDSFLNELGRLFNNIFVHYLFAAIGCYLLFRYLKLSPLIAVCGTIIYLLMPHNYALVLVGHNVKIRALMLLPWVFLTFKYFLDKRTVLSIALFALAFGVQIRTQHYQIIFYTGLLLLAIGFYPAIEDIKTGKYKRLLRSLLMLLAAFIIALGLAAQPLFLAREYLPYSKRGKMTIDIQHKGTERETTETADGVQMEYATRWSTHPKELLSWIVPRIYGGMSSERYSGDAVPSQWRNQPMPGYWGDMPFTQSYEYMGVLALLLAVIGIMGYHRNKMIRSLLIFAVFLILLSFGRHFQLLYGLFYDYVPFFNKFRSPMMSVTVNFFIVAILAVHGLKYLSEYSEKNYLKIVKILAGFIILGVIIWLAAQVFSYTAPRDPYEQNVLSIIKQIRKEMLLSDLLRYFIIIIAGGGAIFLYLKNKLSYPILGLAVILITVIDLFNIQKRYNQNFVDTTKIERQYFAKSSTDQFLLQDSELFRILPFRDSENRFENNKFAYYHQTIGGYDPIKMYTIEELIENCYFKAIDNTIPINWNAMQFLNVKYILIGQKITYPLLELVHEETQGELYTYQFTGYLPRGFFVGDYRVITNAYERLSVINDSSFHPAKTALLEEELPVTIDAPDSSSCTVTLFTPNHLTLEAYTDKRALLVISELYYPPGWKIYLDRKRMDKIYKTNHAVQSVIVPEGSHTIDVTFEPDTYFRMINYARISASVLYLTIAASLCWTYRKKIATFIKNKKK